MSTLRPSSLSKHRSKLLCHTFLLLKTYDSLSNPRFFFFLSVVKFLSSFLLSLLLQILPPPDFSIDDDFQIYPGVDDIQSVLFDRTVIPVVRKKRSYLVQNWTYKPEQRETRRGRMTTRRRRSTPLEQVREKRGWRDRERLSTNDSTHDSYFVDYSDQIFDWVKPSKKFLDSHDEKYDVMSSCVSLNSSFEVAKGSVSSL